MPRDRVLLKMTAARQRLDSLASRVSGRGRIFIATWRDGHNFGDDYLADAMESFVRDSAQGARVVQTNLYLDSYRTNPRDLLIVGGGGLWGPRGDGRLDGALYTAWMKVRCPLVMANLGFESFDPASEPELRNLAAKARLFTLRDQESWRLVTDRLGDGAALWCADTTYLHPLLLDRHPDPRRIAVNLCNPALEGLLPAESSVRIAHGVARLGQVGYSITGVSLRSGGPNPDYAFCRQVDPACPAEFSSDAFRTCGVVIAMRYHAVLLALQNSIPVVAVVCSAKVKRLMEEFGLGEYCADPQRPQFEEELVSTVRNLDVDLAVTRIREGNRRADARLAPFAERLKALLAGR